jgi:glutathione S-transferase
MDLRLRCVLGDLNLKPTFVCSSDCTTVMVPVARSTLLQRRPRISPRRSPYFDFHGGRGEPARLALSIGGIVFEDDRLQTSDWERRKGDTPFGALPVLEVDGQIVAQSNAINRYVGKLADLYPTDPWEAALCDEAMEAVEDITNKIAATLFLPEEQKKAQRKSLVDGPIPFYLTRLQQRLEAHGGRYFAADRLSVADLKVFVWIRHLRFRSTRSCADRIDDSLV